MTSLTITGGSHWVVLGDLDLDATLGLEFGNGHRLEHTLENGRVTLALEAVVESVQISTGDHVVEVRRLAVSNITKDDSRC